MFATRYYQRHTKVEAGRKASLMAGLKADVILPSNAAFERHTYAGPQSSLDFERCLQMS